MSPSIRYWSALALFAFLAAHSLCVIHCHLGSPGSKKGEAWPSCHAAPNGHCQARAKAERQASPASRTESGSAPSQNATCATLKTMLNAPDVSPNVALDVSDLPPSFLASFLQDEIHLASAQAATVRRQAPAADWVVTPVLYLGLAGRSLAPPFAV